MAEQKQQQPSRFKFIWGGAGSAPPTTRSTTRSASGLDRTTSTAPIRRQPTRQPQPPPSSQSRPSVQPRGGTSPPTSTSSAPITTSSNTPKETKNEVEEQKLPREAEKTSPSISKTTDSSQKLESKEVSKLAPQASTSQPDLASVKPELREHKSSTFEAETSPKNKLEEKTSPKNTLETETSPKNTPEAETSPKNTPEAKTSTKNTSEAETSPKNTPEAKTSPKNTLEAETSPKNTLEAHEQTTVAKEPALLVPQETTKVTTSSLEKTQNPTPTSAKSSISTSDIAQKTESSTTSKEPALLVPQKNSPPTSAKSSISKSDVARKPESSPTKEPALLVPQETKNPTNSSPKASLKPIPSIESSNISTKSSESETTTKETLSEKSPQETDKTSIATRDVIKIVRESDHKITNSSNVGNQLPAPTKKETKDDNNISSLVKKTGLDNPKYPIEGKQVTVITLAGENRGASMQLGSDAAKEAIQIHRGYKMNQSEDINNNTNDDKSKETKTKDDAGPTMRTLINNNVQSINNSIVFNSSVSKRDPGVHFALPRVVKEEELAKPHEKKETFNARKMQFEATPSNKVAYEPRIRRRCLKGLFMESSDSDSSDNGKNRRHGCRYVLEEKESSSDMHIQIN